MSVRSQPRLRPATETDLPAVAALSAEIYPNNGPLDRIERHLAWKYRERSTPSCGCVLEEEDGSIAAYIGGLPARAVLDGRSIDILQTTDHLVACRHRTGLRRLGNFARTMRWWCTHYCSPSLHRVGYGFPSHEDERIGVRVARYELIRPVNLLFSSDQERLAGLHSDRMRIIFEPRPPHDADALWLRSAPTTGLAVIRDHTYLDWRFARHPNIDYTFVIARDRYAKLRGIAVVRPGGIADDLFTVVDWIAPADDADAFRELLYALGRFTASRGYAGYCTWFVETTPEFARAQEYGFRVRPTNLALVGRSFDRSIRMENLRRGFLATLGDTDFL